MWTIRSHDGAVLNHWRSIEEQWPLQSVWGGRQRSVWICLLAQLLPHFINPFNEYSLNAHSGPDTVENAKNTMYLGLASRQ